MNGSEIKIDDSYKNLPPLEGKVVDSNRNFTLKMGENISLNCQINFEYNNDAVRIIAIQITDVDKPLGAKTSAHINTTGTFHAGKPAVRLTFNISASGLAKNQVGSCIVKLTADGKLIEYTKTENVSLSI